MGCCVVEVFESLFGVKESCGDCDRYCERAGAPRSIDVVNWLFVARKKNFVSQCGVCGG